MIPRDSENPGNFYAQDKGFIPHGFGTLLWPRRVQWPFIVLRGFPGSCLVVLVSVLLVLRRPPCLARVPYCVVLVPVLRGCFG